MPHFIMLSVALISLSSSLSQGAQTNPLRLTVSLILTQSYKLRSMEPQPHLVGLRPQLILGFKDHVANHPYVCTHAHTSLIPRLKSINIASILSTLALLVPAIWVLCLAFPAHRPLAIADIVYYTSITMLNITLAQRYTYSLVCIRQDINIAHLHNLYVYFLACMNLSRSQ